MARNFTHALAIGILGLALTGVAHATEKTTAGRYIDDAAITASIKAKQAESKTVSATGIGVETVNGVVQLSGFAGSEHEKVQAEKLARSVEGVKSVENDIIVKK